MITVYAGDVLVYDSRLPEYGVTELQVTLGLNKGGTATITMPAFHPAYNAFTSYKTIVTVYRDGSLIFRGRALYPTDDFRLNRTITCEGERCFLRDGVMRPYVYQDGPAAIFADVIALYNAQVEAEKQFVLGTVDVTDPNNYIRFESEDAESFADTVDKLVERVGGYIVFTTNESGDRVINWYEELGYQSYQVIEFGSNLLDFKRTTANSDLATVIIPYGAKAESSGLRLTIESVNDGLDFIQDYDAVGLRGVIAKAVYWDDIDTPEALLAKAQQYLATSKNLITSLELTALDLSQVDQYIDNFELGDKVQVRSRPHGIDDVYQLSEQKLDLLTPGNDRIVLGKDVTSLSGADAAGAKQSAFALQRVEHNVKKDFDLNVAAQIEDAVTTLTSMIQQTSDALKLEVSEQYATNGDVESLISTRMTQLADSITFEFETLTAKVDENDVEARTQFEELHKYIRFEDGNIILGESDNTLTLRIENDRISFLDAGAEVAYFSNKNLTVLDGSFLHSLRIGSFAFRPRENGNLSFVKVG